MNSHYQNWIIQSHEKIHTFYKEINKLDQEIGDGDHGSTILKGVSIAKELFIKNTDLPLDQCMSMIAKEMRRAMGGASGILMSIFFDESGKINTLNLNTSIIKIFENSIVKIQKRGKVISGDKSILDIYEPVLNFNNGCI